MISPLPPSPTFAVPVSSRRRFLSNATCLPFATIAAFYAAAESPLSRRCPIGFGTYGHPGMSLSQSIDLVAKTGFDSIEIVSMPGYHGAPDQLTPEQRKAIGQRITDQGLQLGALMGLPNPNRERIQSDRRSVQKMLQLATDLAPKQPPIIQSVLGGGRWEDLKTLYRDVLGDWTRLASEANVRLAIKPHRSHAMSLPEHAIWLIEQLGKPDSLCMVYDHSHYAYRELKIETLVDQALPYTGYIVVKDIAMVDGKTQFALPGEIGSIPHGKILQRFIAGGYRGEVCCEVSSQVWRQPNYSPQNATEICYRNLSKMTADIDES
ncbi:TIM barrel protein [Roseiconus lacunae]|uniref:sugar phosphate isomerase/epimerase family protein n=1 Tax=Roseiconus lacunae TaxID=2605694 RepID=UPI0011F26699